MIPARSFPPRACSPQVAFRYLSTAPARGELRRVISGGQTGVDRAALDAALALGYEAGGWCPQGRQAEDGRIPPRFPLRETASDRYPQRTALNVRDADATLILHLGAIDNGTRLTEEIAWRMGKPLEAINLVDRDAFVRARAWLRESSPEVLNVAGPRESRHPGIYARSYALLVRLLAPGSGRVRLAGVGPSP